MARTIGYMLTWTTYGTWLQGDDCGYVKDGRTLPGDKRLVEICENFQKESTIRLGNEERDIVRKTILKEAERIGYVIEALAVCSNHIHLVVRIFPEPVGQTVSRFKNVTSYALRKNGRTGRIWTRGFDKRFCLVARPSWPCIHGLEAHDTERNRIKCFQTQYVHALGGIIKYSLLWGILF